MKKTLTKAFNAASISLRLAHVTWVDKRRSSYVDFLTSSYGINAARLAPYGRNDLRQIFANTNHRAALNSFYFGGTAYVALRAALALGVAAAAPSALSLAIAGACLGAVFAFNALTLSRSADTNLRIKEIIQSIDDLAREEKDPAGCAAGENPAAPSP